MPNALQSRSNGNEVNDMGNFLGIENLDTTWLEGTNLLSWFPPGTDYNPPMDGQTI
jgi:hypothetical protein